jgi:hypothetical protein
VKLFQKKTATAASSKRGSNRIEIVYDESGLKGLAFGLQWRSIVTSGGRDAAVKIARTGNATHYVFSGQQVGFGSLPTKGAAITAKLYPAASIVARLHAGDCVYVVKIGEGEYWVALTRNGSPTSNDHFLAGDDAQALALARQVIDQIAEDGAMPVVYSNIENSGFDDVKPASIQDIMDCAMSMDELLVKLPKQASSIPMPLLAFAGVMLIVMAGNYGYKWWTAKQRAKLAAEMAVVELDGPVVWARALNDWQASVAATDALGMDKVRESIAEIPVTWDGWTMTTTTCTAGLLAAGVRPWSCTAVFTRDQGGSLTREINAQMPTKWTVTYTPLNQMVLAWTISQSAAAIQVNKLPKSSFHTIETTSRLQKLERILSQSATFKFAPVVIPAPKRSDGSVYPPDPMASGIVQAVISIQGPLRSIDAAMHANLDVAWDKYTLTYTSQSSDPSINASALSVAAAGVIYAKD